MTNPKQTDTNLRSCRSQTGSCPNNCNQCYYNRPGAYYNDIHKPNLPDPKDIGSDTIIRVNAGHDSNIEREKVIADATKYQNYFFNTSIPNFDFPGPVVFTANKSEEDAICNIGRTCYPSDVVPLNLMFVRLRVSASNIGSLYNLITSWILADVPVVLTFMRYYDVEVLKRVVSHAHPYLSKLICYEEKTHVANKYWCPTRQMKAEVCRVLHVGKNRLLSTCGTIDSNLCKDCRNCEAWYWVTKHRLDTTKQLGA
jgi:hypothetical protein